MEGMPPLASSPSNPLEKSVLIKDWHAESVSRCQVVTKVRAAAADMRQVHNLSVPIRQTGALNMEFCSLHIHGMI